MDANSYEQNPEFNHAPETDLSEDEKPVGDNQLDKDMQESDYSDEIGSLKDDQELEREQNDDDYFPLRSSEASASNKLERRGRPKGQSRASLGSAYPCKYCSFSYSEYTNLRAHLRANHKDKISSSSQSIDRPKEQRRHSYGTQHPCKFCSFSYRDIHGLRAHLKAVHTEQINAASDSSSRTPSGIKGRPKGQSRHSYGSAFPCQYCSCSYKDKTALNGHLKTVHRKEQNAESNFQCEYPGCRKKFPTEFGKTLHQSAHQRKIMKIKKEIKEEEDILLVSHASPTVNDLVNISVHQKIDQVTRASKVLSVTNLFSENKAMNRPTSSSNTHQLFSQNPASYMVAPVINVHPSNSLSMPVMDENAVNMDFSPSTFSSIEKSPLPLVAAIFSNARENPAEMMVIWCNRLEDDILSAVTLNKKNTILCIQNLDFFDASNQQKNMVKNGDMTKFIILDESGAFSQWTAITFDYKIPPFGIKNKCFKSFAEVEKIFSEHAASHGMDIVNMMRYNEDGFYRIPSQKLTKKVLLCNCS